MTALDIRLDSFHLEGRIYTTRLERRLNKVQGKGDRKLFLETLKEFNPSAYNQVRRLIRGAIWKTRRSKFKRYYNNIVKRLEECDYV